MAEDREQRISSALSSLIDKILPPFEDEDDASFDERQSNALELARTILARCVCAFLPSVFMYDSFVNRFSSSSPIAPAVEADGKKMLMTAFEFLTDTL